MDSFLRIADEEKENDATEGKKLALPFSAGDAEHRVLRSKKGWLNPPSRVLSSLHRSAWPGLDSLRR